MTHSSVAASVRKTKEAHPERYCPVKNCLWSLRSGPCRKHGPIQPKSEEKKCQTNE